MRRILKRKKYSYIWAKYDLEDQQNPQERAKFKEKLGFLFINSTRAAGAFTGMVLLREWF